MVKMQLWLLIVDKNFCNLKALQMFDLSTIQQSIQMMPNKKNGFYVNNYLHQDMYNIVYNLDFLDNCTKKLKNIKNNNIFIGLFIEIFQSQHANFCKAEKQNFVLHNEPYLPIDCIQEYSQLRSMVIGFFECFINFFIIDLMLMQDAFQAMFIQSVYIFI